MLNNIASRDKGLASPKWQSVMWGVLISAVAIVLLGAGGLPILQTMTLIASLPFAVLMIFYDGFFVESPEQRCQLFCNRRQSGQYFLVG